MASVVVESIKQQANKIIFTQCIAVGVVCLIIFVLKGRQASIAAFIGGLVYIAPCFCYAKQLLTNLSANAIKRIMLTFYLGELVKLIVSIGLFVTLYNVMNLPIWPYFFGYLVAVLSFCIAPVFVFKRTNVKS